MIDVKQAVAMFKEMSVSYTFDYRMDVAVSIQKYQLTSSFISDLSYGRTHSFNIVLQYDYDIQNNYISKSMRLLSELYNTLFQKLHF